MDETHVKKVVQEYYAEIARGNPSGCCVDTSSCCTPADSLIQIAGSLEETSVQAADLGLSCGMPTQYANIKSGDTVLDLGSGAGVDVLRAARQVGEAGLAIGVDMTPEMIARAQQNASNGGYTNVEFRLGEIEALPVDDKSIDVVLSNCVINLVPDKRRAFREIYRVLRPGGHLSISDMVIYGEMPDAIRQDLSLWAGCLSGAINRDQYLQIIRDCGFDQVVIHQEIKYNPVENTDASPEKQSEADENFGVASITLEATKPA